MTAGATPNQPLIEVSDRAEATIDQAMAAFEAEVRSAMDRFRALRG